MGGEAVANGDDITDWDGAERLVEQAIDTFGGLDVLINNAGILRDRMLANMTEAEWDAVIKVHLKGTFGPARHAAAYWRERSKAGETIDGRIINTSSPSGIYGNVGQTNYGAAKAGIAAFTIIAAMELARYGVTVNAIAPAALTRMTENLGMGQAPEEIKEQMSPRWIAPIVTWLASARVARRHRAGVRRLRPRLGGRGLAPRARRSSTRSTTRRARAAGLGARGPGPPQRRHAGLRRADPTRRRAGDATDADQPRRRGHQGRARPTQLDQQGRAALRPGRGRRRADPLDELQFTTENTDGHPAAGAAHHGRRARRARRRCMGAIGTFNPAMLVHGEQAIELHRRDPRRGRARDRRRDHRHLRQGQGRGRRVRDHRHRS